MPKTPVSNPMPTNLGMKQTQWWISGRSKTTFATSDHDKTLQITNLYIILINHLPEIILPCRENSEFDAQKCVNSSNGWLSAKTQRIFKIRKRGCLHMFWLRHQQGYPEISHKIANEITVFQGAPYRVWRSRSAPTLSDNQCSGQYWIFTYLI